MSAHADAAIALARRPFVAGVFPLRVNSKHEHKTGHEHDRTHATKDADTIRAMWAKSPRANIAYFVAPGFVVAEADPRNGGKLEADSSTYNAHTAKGADSLHIAYRLPDGMNFTGSFDARPGVELHGAGQRMVGAGSTIAGKSYRVLHDVLPIGNAPAWIVEAIEAHQAAQLAKAAMRATSTATVAPAVIDNERGRRWADAALLYLSADLHEAKQGTRNDAIRRIAYKAGQLASYLPLDVIEAHMLAACATFAQPAKVAATVRKQIAAGAQHPRHPLERDEHTHTRRALAAMTALLDSAQWGRKMPYTRRNKKREVIQATVRGATVRVALAGILQQATKANTFDVRLSERHTAEMAQCGKGGSRSILQATQHAEMLVLIDDRNRETTDSQGESVFEGNQYRLTAAGFLAIQRAEFWAQDGASVSQHERESITTRPLSPSCWLTVAPSCAQAETDDARALGVFGHRQLGRCAYVVARCLATAGALTAPQIETHTGFCRSTVRDVLRRLASHGLVERGGRAQPSRLADDFEAKAKAYAEDEGLAARKQKREDNHKAERKSLRDAIARRKAERDALPCLTAEDVRDAARVAQHPDLVVIESTVPKPAAKDGRALRNANAIDALRNQREAREYWAARDAETAIQGAPHARVEFGVNT